MDEKGTSAEVVIPYGQFLEIVGTYGLDLSEDEVAGLVAGLREARQDSAAGRRSAFVSGDEVRGRWSIIAMRSLPEAHAGGSEAAGEVRP